VTEGEYQAIDHEFGAPDGQDASDFLASAGSHRKRSSELAAAEGILCMRVGCSLCRAKKGASCLKPNGGRTRSHVERRRAAGLLPPKAPPGAARKEKKKAAGVLHRRGSGNYKFSIHTSLCGEKGENVRMTSVPRWVTCPKCRDKIAAQRAAAKERAAVT